MTVIFSTLIVIFEMDFLFRPLLIFRLMMMMMMMTVRELAYPRVVQ